MPNRLVVVWIGLPRAVRLILASYLIGALGGTTLAALLLATNAQGLRDLILGSANPWIPLVLFTAQLALTFAALAAAVAVMRLSSEAN